MEKWTSLMVSWIFHKGLRPRRWSGMKPKVNFTNDIMNFSKMNGKVTEFCTSDYSDFDLNNECIEEEFPESLINTIDEQNNENLNEPIKEPVDEPIPMRKQINKDDVIIELVRVYSNNALITGNEKWIGDCKNDIELKNKLMSEIDRLTHEKNIKDDNCILNFENISFFIDSYKDDNIDEKYILFYSYCGIYDKYVETNHLNIELAERYK